MSLVIRQFEFKIWTCRRVSELDCAIMQKVRHYTLDLSMRDTNLGKQLVDARILFSSKELSNEINSWCRDDKLIQMLLSEVEIAGAGSEVYYVNTYYVRADKPPDSSAKLVKIVHLDVAGLELVSEVGRSMLGYEIKKRELKQQLADLRDEERETGFELFGKICEMFGVGLLM